MNSKLSAPIALALLALASPAALAQSGSDWSGGYIGIFGGSLSDDDGGDTILFDNNLDGDFGDTVRNAAGANAFSAGFCDGVAATALPAGGCAENSTDSEFGVRAGFDWQSGQWLFGLVGEYSSGDVRDAVTAFSITPARYTMIRDLDSVLAIRGRAGMVFGESNENLFYVTGGFARADIDNSFLTSNTVNTFSNSGNNTASGMQLGLGYERRFNNNWTLGVEYLTTSLDDDDFIVRTAGPAPATNAFILVNPAGTDFARSDDEIELDSFRLTLNYRF